MIQCSSAAHECAAELFHLGWLPPAGKTPCGGTERVKKGFSLGRRLPPAEGDVGEADRGRGGKRSPFPSRGRQFPYRLAMLATSPNGGSMRGEQHSVWLPLTRELSAQLTEGEKYRRFCKPSIFSPSVKACGFATSLVRGRLKFSPTRQCPQRGRSKPLPYGGTGKTTNGGRSMTARLRLSKKLTLQLTDTGQRGSARGTRPASQYNNLPSKDLIYQGF